MTKVDDVAAAFDVLHEAIKQCNLALMNLAALGRDCEDRAVWEALDYNFEALAGTADIGSEVCETALGKRRHLGAVDDPTS